MDNDDYFLWYILFEDMPLKVEMCDDCKKKYDDHLKEQEKENAINQTLYCLHEYEKKREEIKTKTKKKPIDEKLSRKNAFIKK